MGRFTRKGKVVVFRFSLGPAVHCGSEWACCVDRVIREWPFATIQDVGSHVGDRGKAEVVGVECIPLTIRDAKDIECGIAAFEQGGNGGLVVSLHPIATVHRYTITAAAAQHRLPAIYPQRYFVATGGLMSYGADLATQYRRAAGYVDRILRGGKPADLPVQKATKYELTINLQTAKALGLDVPLTLRGRADEVIE
jgi:putative tryptophan/tyrosine transport system substrate-binding protein